MSEDGGLKPGPSPLRRAPSSSGFLVTDTTFMTSRFPPWRIRAVSRQAEFPLLQGSPLALEAAAPQGTGVWLA